MAASRARVLLLLIIYLGFISLGLPDGTFGVAWAQAHATLGAPLGLGGTIVLVVTLLSATAGFTSGAIVGRFTIGPVVLISGLLTGSALMLIAHAPTFAWILPAAVPLGLGAGAVDAGLNGYVARHYSRRHMHWLHACWGLGATLGPVVMTRAIGSGAGWRGGYFALGIVQLSLALVFLATLRWWSAVPERAWTAAETNGTRASEAPRAGANSLAGWLSVLIFAAYTALELTAGVWANSILVLARGIPQETAGLCTAAYYAAITSGRIVVGFVGERWSNRWLVTSGVGLALVGALLFSTATTPSMTALALVILGLGFAPVYPGLMHEVPRRFVPEAVQTVIGRQSGAGCVGAASLPAAAGWLAHYSLESIAWVVLGGTVLLLLGIRRLDRLT